jgi:acyl-coenzyme A thioesterase PaaI-like protein
VKLSVTELPFNKFVGIQIADEAAHLLRLPSGKQYLNHLGTVHASA